MRLEFSLFVAAAIAAAVSAAPAAEPAAGAGDARIPFADRVRRIKESVEETADARFFHSDITYRVFKGQAARGEGDAVAEALLLVARENAAATNETQRVRFEFAVTWLDEFGNTNALPFLLSQMRRKELRGKTLPELSKSRHMTVASFFRIANRFGATNELRAAAAMLADGEWTWMRPELYYEATRTVGLHEAAARLEAGEGAAVDLAPVREPVCGFLADCYATEDDPARFEFLDGFVRARLPEWETSAGRLEGARRMLRLHPDSKAAADILQAARETTAGRETERDTVSARRENTSDPVQRNQ